ncbi:MAG: FG-GAP-like repeat-containing protein, partial [Candidatus Thermoplasmatota archaeon]|nr:FG-GAP-like repeat-containing protein [Candidatus Thermoplasmatota archaeon]
FVQKGVGGFSPKGTTFSGATRPTWPRIADFDGDGKNDVVCGGLNKNFIFLKQKDGALSSTSKKWDSTNGVMDVAAGDFNGDGLIDAATANSGGNNVGLWIQRTEYQGTWTSNAIVQPLLMRYINFTYNIESNGGDTHLYFSHDGGTIWTEIVNSTTYDLINRTHRVWIKVTTFATSASSYDIIKYIHLNMTYQTYPTNLRLDLGRDGTTEWNMSGELDGETELTTLADALTSYVQDKSHPADEEGYVTVPLEIYSRTPGILKLQDLNILYNNASRRPELVYPEDRGFINATPTLQFFANDTDDDLLKYNVQINRGGDFNDPLKTMTFDMRYNLFNQEEGEGFPEADYPEGSLATFTVPDLYALDDDTTYKWRVYAYDGYLLSRASPVYIMKVDSHAPTGHASTPRFSNMVNFTVTWSAEDVMPGSGLATLGTFDVQYRKSTEPSWNEWITYSTETSAIFQGEEGVTYYFRMRSRDVVWNEQLYIGGKGDTQTTVDSRSPVVVFSDMPGFHDTRTFLVRWTGTDFMPGSGIKYYDLQVRKEDRPWADWLVEFKSSQSVYTADSDKTYHFRVRATDSGGNRGDWSEVFSVRIDATPPVLLEAPEVPLDGEEVWSDLDSLTVQFAFVDQESGMSIVEVAIGTDNGLYDVMPPTTMDYPPDGVLVLENLPLINSYTYFVGVKAENMAGSQSNWAWSDGVLVAIPGPEATMSYPSGRLSDIKVPIEISV